MVDIMSSHKRKSQESIVGYIGYFTIGILMFGAIFIQTIFYQNRIDVQKSEALAQGQDAMSIDDILSMLTTLTSILGPLVASIIGYYFQEERNSSGGP